MRTGATKKLTRTEAIEEYVVFRIRAEEIIALDYLLHGFKIGPIPFPENAPVSKKLVVDTVRTCFFAWFASLTDRHEKSVYPFNCLLALFEHRRAQIISVQNVLEACHSKLHEFRNNVGPHVRSSVAAHIKARRQLQNRDNFNDLMSAIGGFRRLLKTLKAEEAVMIPELAETLEKLGVTQLTTFAEYYRKTPNNRT